MVGLVGAGALRLGVGMTSYYDTFEVQVEPNASEGDSEWGNPLEDVSGFGGSDEWHVPGDDHSWTTSWTSWRQGWQGRRGAENWSWDERASSHQKRCFAGRCARWEPKENDMTMCSLRAMPGSSFLDTSQFGSPPCGLGPSLK